MAARFGARPPITFIRVITYLMHKIIFIGGTMESKFALDYVANFIQRRYPNAHIYTFTYAFALKHRHAINKTIKGATLITHSSGAIVIERGATPKRAIFICPTQPIARYKIFTRALIKTVYHSWKIFNFEKRRKVMRILMSNLNELLLHPIGNLGPFIRGDVSEFDLRDVLPRHPVAKSTRIVISERDEMFKKSENMFEELATTGVQVTHIDAMHDEIFIDTDLVLDAALGE